MAMMSSTVIAFVVLDIMVKIDFMTLKTVISDGHNGYNGHNSCNGHIGW